MQTPTLQTFPGAPARIRHPYFRHPYSWRAPFLLASLAIAGLATGGPAAQAASRRGIRDRIDSTIKIGPLLSSINRVSGVTLTPHASSADISFSTTQEATPTVNIGTATPFQNQNGDWAFKPTDATRSYNAGLGPKQLQHAIQLYGLEPATTYHYIITAPSGKPDGVTGQETGTFKTISQKVKLVFDTIKILLPGEAEGGQGELFFRLWARPGEASVTAVDVDPFLLSAGGSKNIAKEMVIAAAPDLLTLQVDGYEDDSNQFGNDAIRFAFNTPVAGAGRNGDRQWNPARVTIDLNQYPSPPGQRMATGGFELRSVPGNGGDELRFVVSGHFEVTRPRTGRSSRIGDAIKVGGPYGPASEAVRIGGTPPWLSSIPGATTPAVTTPAIIYAITPEGILQWRRYNGAAVGGGYETWQGYTNVGRGWDGLKQAVPGGGNILYAVTGDGTLRWYQHNGFNTGTGLETAGSWATNNAGTGWGDFKQVFPGGDGVLYAITGDGKLEWRRHNAFMTGASQETPGAWDGPKEIDTGWGDYKQVFSGGEGVIYTIAADGKLEWRCHNGFLTGASSETPGAWTRTRNVGAGWGDFKQVFSSGGGIIYGITTEGKLLWYKHTAYLTGGPANMPGAWDAHSGTEVGRGWGDFSTVFALLPATTAPVH